MSIDKSMGTCYTLITVKQTSNAKVDESKRKLKPRIQGKSGKQDKRE